MGTRTYSRRGVLTAAGRRRAGLEAIDILGRPIPDRVAPVAAEAQRDADLATVKTGESLTKYLNDPSTYPPNTYDYFEGDTTRIFDENTNDLSTPVGRKNQVMMERLGLNPESDEHKQIYIALMGINPKTNLFISETNIRDSQGQAGSASKINGAVITSARTIRTVNPDSIVIENSSFQVNDPNNILPGMGYAMIRKQAWAARRLGEITGKEITVFTKALSVDSRLNSAVGVHVWPKIGYNFELSGNNVLALIVQRNGFQSTNTADLMSEKLPDGRSGYSMWVNMVDEAVRRSGGELWLTGRVKMTDDSSPGLQVLQAAGRRKGLSKVGSQSGDDGFNITPEDDAYLGALWQKFGKKR